jgi:hypothetical protein
MNCLKTENIGTHQRIARKLALDAVTASWIAKTAKSGRKALYSVKARKIDFGLRQFPSHFRVVRAELDPSLGVLLLVKLPIRHRGGNRAHLHVPLGDLSAPCQQQLRGTVDRLMMKSRGYAIAA